MIKAYKLYMHRAEYLNAYSRELGINMGILYVFYNFRFCCIKHYWLLVPFEGALGPTGCASFVLNNEDSFAGEPGSSFQPVAFYSQRMIEWEELMFFKIKNIKMKLLKMK